MTDNGYNLVRVELLNWGNFHGYQKFQLADLTHNFGPLFTPSSASAVLGINGSGKSTLIDGIMMTLLPFENSLKLGVTNDLEIGGGGGRTIKDYVLGKHSSTNSQLGTEIKDGFGRKDGCSMFVLVFQHNANIRKYITLGRVWWYQNYQVSETHLAFLGFDSITIPEICAQGETPKNSKIFRTHMKETRPNFQVFDTLQNYFAALSSSFGGISRDDLKILNRAFYVKSISQIDQFIRENMLMEQENPHMERLLENVRNGQEIAYAIETCEAKIRSAERILKEVTKLQEFSESRKELDLKMRVSGLYTDWVEIENHKIDLVRLAEDIGKWNSELPQLKELTKQAEVLLGNVQGQLLQNNVEATLEKLNLQIEQKSIEIKRCEDFLSSINLEVKRLKLSLPEPQKWGQLKQQLPDKLTGLQDEIVQLSEDVENLRQEKVFIDLQAKELIEELRHLSENKSLLPRDLYTIKAEAQKELKIERENIYFVGELIQVKPEFNKYRKAIESVLFPISRNLLVHPEYLQAMTQWLDKTGLRSDLVVKRIQTEELETDDFDVTVFEGDHGKDTDRILNMIELLPDSDHNFVNYLKKWLSDVFDYTVVSPKEFKRNNGKLVTAEGLVKADSRTMRKLKANFHFSLGWDNEDLIQQKTMELVELQNRLGGFNNKIQENIAKIRLFDEQSAFYRQLLPQMDDIALLGDRKAHLKSLVQEKSFLVKENPDYAALKLQEEKLKERVRACQKEESQTEINIQTKSKQRDLILQLLPAREESFKQTISYIELLSFVGAVEALLKHLQDLHDYLKNSRPAKSDYDLSLHQNLKQLDISENTVRSYLADFLQKYRNDFNDPNLPYLLPNTHEVTAFINQWMTNRDRLVQTDLPSAQEKWKSFFDQILMDSVKDTINEIKSRLFEVEQNILSINDVLKLTNFENLVNEQRYLRIHHSASTDERIRKFRRQVNEIEKILGVQVRTQIEEKSQEIISVLVGFVDELQKDLSFRQFVTDVRNHFHFEVHSLRRNEIPSDGDSIVEVFTGAKKDAKSSAQTTHLAYTLLASCLAYRFKFNDPVLGKETPRIIILDEFGGKFDNEKPKEVIKLLDKMGFQSILVSPMSKGDLLAESVSHMVLVHKASATHSKVHSVAINSKEDYDRMLRGEGATVV